MSMLNLKHHYSNFQSDLIIQKSFDNADLVLKKHFFLFLMLKTVVLLNFFFFFVKQ